MVLLYCIVLYGMVWYGIVLYSTSTSRPMQRVGSVSYGLSGSSWANLGEGPITLSLFSSSILETFKRKALKNTVFNCEFKPPFQKRVVKLHWFPLRACKVSLSHYSFCLIYHSIDTWKVKHCIVIKEAP